MTSIAARICVMTRHRIVKNVHETPFASGDEVFAISRKSARSDVCFISFMWIDTNAVFTKLNTLGGPIVRKLRF